MVKILRIVLLVVVLTGCSKESIDLITINYNPYEVVVNIDYKQPSYLTRIPFPKQVMNYRKFSDWHPPLEAVVLDYDKDGYLDIVETQSEYGVFKRNKIVFFKGTKEGDLVLDTENSDIFEGLIHGRKGLVGDFNNDGWPDIFFIGHGYDHFTGEYPNEEHPILLFNQQGKSFKYVPMVDVVGFFHTGTSGDIDGDGDLDIILIDGAKGGMNSYVLLNNGDGTFQHKLLGSYDKFSNEFLPRLGGKFTSELIDIDNDGDLDLVLAGHEFEGWSSPPLVLFNSLDGFTSSLDLPIDEVYGIVNDIDFYDFNSDGKLEIIFTSTKGVPFYQGFKIRVYNLGGKNITSDIFNSEDSLSDNGQWMYWMSFAEKEGSLYFQGDDMFTTTSWKLEKRKFKRVN